MLVISHHIAKPLDQNFTLYYFLGILTLFYPSSLPLLEETRGHWKQRLPLWQCTGEVSGPEFFSSHFQNGTLHRVDPQQRFCRLIPKENRNSLEIATKSRDRKKSKHPMCSSTNSDENTLSAWKTLSGSPLCVDWICGAVLSRGFLLASEKPGPPVSGYTVMCTSELFRFLIKTLFSFLQICSQLSTRLETQQAASREELEVVKVRRSENALCCGFLQIHAVLRQYPRGSPAPRAWPRPRRPSFWRHAHPAPLGGWRADSVSGRVWCSSLPAERPCSHRCQGLSQAGRGSSALSQEAPEPSCSVDAWEALSIPTGPELMWLRRGVPKGGQHPPLALHQFFGGCF